MDNYASLLLACCLLLREWQVAASITLIILLSCYLFIVNNKYKLNVETHSSYYYLQLFTISTDMVGHELADMGSGSYVVKGCQPLF